VLIIRADNWTLYVLQLIDFIVFLCYTVIEGNVNSRTQFCIFRTQLKKLYAFQLIKNVAIQKTVLTF